MKIELPDIGSIFNVILNIESSFDNRTLSIKEWVTEHRNRIRKNQQLYQKSSGSSDIEIFKIFVADLLMRAMRGEKGELISESLKRIICSKSDCHHKNFEKVIKESKYRFNSDGVKVLEEFYKFVDEDLQWKWSEYFNDAESNVEDNFQNDKILKIKYVSFKVRDLALSNFSHNYLANDLHIVRVSTRLGLLNYGFDLLKSDAIEMGNNPSNDKNYLFLHKLFLKISKMTGNSFSPVDIDRMLWHFGRTICNSTPQCSVCHLNSICLTGIARKVNE